MSQTLNPGTSSADFQSSVSIDASPGTVFDALTTTGGLSAWWTPVTGSGLAGGTLTFAFDEERLIVHVETAERPGHVRWNVLSCEMLEDWVGTSVDFTVTANATGGANVQLRHEGLAVLECFEMCRRGWTFFFEKSLPAYVASGRGYPNGSLEADERHR